MPLSPKNEFHFLFCFISITKKRAGPLGIYILHTTFFIFNGTYYQQTEGVAMEGLPSLIVAEIYMQATKTTAITTTNYPPKVWECHVDDVFSIICPTYMTSFNMSTAFTPRKSLPWKLNRTPNGYPKKFINNTIRASQLPKQQANNDNTENPFLDTLVQRNIDSNISFRVYRKPTHTDQYLKFTSHHLSSAITSLFDRAKSIISNPSNQEKDENHLTAVRQANGYPKKFINNTIRASQLPKQPANNDNTENQEQIAPAKKQSFICERHK